jgi:gentisate 1,2-dioxygenase
MKSPGFSAKSAEFYARLSPVSLAPLWEVMKGLVPAEPRSKVVAHAWSYKQVRPLLLEAGRLLTAEEAERRVLVLENPNLVGTSRATATLYSGFQLIMPGETAPAHRHTASALRFMVEGEGGSTTVAGERTRMRRGDFVVTPNGAFHDHMNDGDAPVIWLDGLDVAIVNYFEAGFSEEYQDGAAQQVTRKAEESLHRFGAGLLPMEAKSPFGKTSPIFNYAYDRSREALMAVASAEKPDPHFGHVLRYANPIDGGWVMPTIATWLSYLPAGFETEEIKSTDGQVLIVAEGELVAQIGDKSFTLLENDVLAVPSWTSRRFQARKNSVVFTMSDRSAQEKLGFWREARA